MNCPNCGKGVPWAQTWRFKGEPVDTYFLCKWCGWRYELGIDPTEGTLAIPVYHDHPGGRVGSWVEFKTPADYRTLTWPCKCGESIVAWDWLRPYPRFSNDPRLMEY